MERFQPSAEDISTAKEIAQKNRKTTVWVNDAGEFFLEEEYAKISVKGNKNRYAQLDFNESGDVGVMTTRKHKLTAEDLEANPLLQSHYKVGDTIEVPEQAEHKPDLAAKKTKVQKPAAGNNNGEGDGSSVGDQGAGEQKVEPPFDITGISLPNALKGKLKGLSDLNLLVALVEAEKAGKNRGNFIDIINERIQAVQGQ